MSNALRLSQYVSLGNFQTVYQGQPYNITINNIQSSSAKLSFSFVGTPISYEILIYQNKTLIQTFNVNYNTDITIPSLVPNTTYSVNVKSIYISGDTFLGAKNKVFTSLNESFVTNIQIQSVKNKYFENKPSNTSCIFSFVPSIGVPSLYNITITGSNYTTYSNSILESPFTVTNLLYDSSYLLEITTFYPSSNSYKTQQSFHTINEKPLENITISTIRGNSAVIGFEELLNVTEQRLYVNGVLNTGIKTDRTITILNLRPKTLYNFYIETVFLTNNIYRSIDLSFQTLNESSIESIDLQEIKRNSIKFRINDSSGNPSYAISFNGNTSPILDRTQVYTDLSENTNYFLTVITSYSYTLNSYFFTYPFTTLYEGNVTNISVIPYGTFSHLSWTPYTILDTPPSTPLNYTVEILQNSILLQNIFYSLTSSIKLDENVLLPDTSYNYRINSIYSSEIYSTTSETVRSLNERPFINILANTVTGNTVVLEMSANSILPNVKYTINIKYNSDLPQYQYEYEYTSTNPNPSSLTVSDLLFNTDYTCIVTTTYREINQYHYSFPFTTKNEYAVPTSVIENKNTILGDSIIIKPFELNQNTFTIRLIKETTEVDSKTRNAISFTDSTPIVFNELDSSSNYQLIVISGYTVTNNNYVSTYLFKTLNEGPPRNVNLKIYNTFIDISFSIAVGNVNTYSYLLVSLDTTPIIQKTQDISRTQFSIDVSQNRNYAFSLISHYDDKKKSYRVTKKFKTLDENTVTISSQNIVYNNNSQIVLDAVINGDNYTGNLFIKNGSISIIKSITPTLFPFTISSKNTITGNIFILYNNSFIDSGNNIIYVSRSYTSDSFSILPNTDFSSISYLTNGTVLSPPDGNSLNDPRGFIKSTPFRWENSSFVYVTGNAITKGNTNLLLYKYSPTNIDNYFAILYTPSFYSYPSNLKQTIQYIFAEKASISFYYALQSTTGTVYNNRSTTSSQIELKVVIQQNNTLLYETSPFITTDTSWNFIYLKLNNFETKKNVEFSIQRTKFELNNLYITDISFVTDLSFTTVPFLKSVSYFSLPYSSSFLWRTNGVLASNMMVSVWVYLHNVSFSTNKYILWFGSDTFPSIYIDSNSKIFDISMVSNVPVFLTFCYYNQKLTIYKNGIVNTGPSKQICVEPLQNTIVFFGKPDSDGYLFSNLELYDNIFDSSGILHLYTSTKLKYSTLLNMVDISNDTVYEKDTMEYSTEIILLPFHGSNDGIQRSLYYQTIPNTGNIVPLSGNTLSFWLKTSNVSFQSMQISTVASGFQNSAYYLGENITSIKPALNTWTHYTIQTNGNVYINGYFYNNYNPFSYTGNLEIYGNQSIGHLKMFGNLLTDTQVLSNYYDLYYLRLQDVSRNVYSVNVSSTLAADLSLSYILSTGSSTIVGNTTKNQTVDISINPFILNDTRKTTNTGVFTLVDYGTSLSLDLSGPFLTYNTIGNTINEGNSVSITLNTSLTNTYRYDISGRYGNILIDNNYIPHDISGTISYNANTITITSVANYKTDGLEYFTFLIPELGISQFINIIDTSIEFLITSSKDAAKENETFTIALSGLYPSTLLRYDISGIILNDISGSSLTGNITSSELSYTVKTTLQKTFKIYIVEYPHIFKKVIFNDLPQPTLKVNNETQYVTNEGTSFTITLISPLSKPIGTIYSYSITGIQDYNLYNTPINGNIITEQLSETEIGGNVIIEISNNQITEGQQTLLFSLVGNDVSNVSIPIYIIDTSLSPSYNLSSNVTEVKTDNSTFIISLTTTGISDGTKVPYVISGVDTTDISYVSLTGNFDVSSNNKILSFSASKYKQTNGDKIFTLSLTEYPTISISVQFKDTNPRPEYIIRTIPLSNYFTDTANFSFYLKTNVSVPSNTPSRYLLSGISYNTSDNTANTVKLTNIDSSLNASYVGNVLSGIFLSSQDFLDISASKVVTIPITYTNPFTLKISSNQPNIPSTYLGINYSASNPLLFVNPLENMQSNGSTGNYICTPDTIIKMAVILYGYKQNLTYTIGDISGIIFYDISGFQQTTQISYSFTTDVSFSIFLNQTRKFNSSLLQR